MSLRPKLQNVGKRDWGEIRDAWLEHVPDFPFIEDPRQRPSLERLQTLLDFPFPRDHERFPDVEGLRTIALWEAVFLFHKCAHTALASQRLGSQGMHSWCLFNGYHSAYLGAKGIMAMLGVALPELHTRPVLIDLFPVPEKKNRRKGTLQISSGFNDFLLVLLEKKLDQQATWETFQRVINMSYVACWDSSLRQELLDLNHTKITPPRNHFLYKTQYWPFGDLNLDESTQSGMIPLIGDDLDPGNPGFLMRLNFSVYRLFEQLMSDLAAYSSPIRKQLDESRFLIQSGLPELYCYEAFIAQINLPTH